jgi:hypothetical protein
LVQPWCLKRSHVVQDHQGESRHRRASTGLDKIRSLSDHLMVRSPIQQGSHEPTEFGLMSDKDDTAPRREIFPSILSCMWYRNP